MNTPDAMRVSDHPAKDTAARAGQSSEKPTKVPKAIPAMMGGSRIEPTANERNKAAFKIRDIVDALDARKVSAWPKGLPT